MKINKKSLILSIITPTIITCIIFLILTKSVLPSIASTQTPNIGLASREAESYKKSFSNTDMIILLITSIAISISISQFIILTYATYRYFERKKKIYPY